MVHTKMGHMNQAVHESYESYQPVDLGEQNDRFGLTMFGSLLLHMIIILGVSFAIPKLKEIKGLPTLEITLVQTTTNKAPDKADFLAQANQDGGGNSEKNEKASNPLPIREIGETNQDQLALPTILNKQTNIKTEYTDLMSQDKDPTRIQLKKPTPEKTELQRFPTPPGLFQQNDTDEERSRLSAEVSRFWNDYQKLPRHKYINARTRQYKYATYLDNWRARVERIGNLNYPEEAKRENLSGSLVLNVTLNANGGVENILVVRSSGKKLLDDAASRIVELAAPFQPFPPEIRRETDVLHITRTWQFNAGSVSAVQ